jgi:hypothetical protein
MEFEGDNQEVIMVPISGQHTVTTAGSAEALGSMQINGPLMVKALPGNAGSIAVGNDGANDVTTSNGLLLAAGDAVVFDFVGDLGSVYLDAENDGDGVAWLVLNV